MLIPKHMFNIFSKNNNLTKSNTSSNKKKGKKNHLWKTHVPPIPLTQTHLPDQNTLSKYNKDTIQPSQPTLTNRLILYFSNENKLKRAKLPLECFKHIIDNEGNIISPPDTNKNAIYVINDFLSPTLAISDFDLDLYKLLTNNLNIPKLLIKKQTCFKNDWKWQHKITYWRIN